MKPDYGAYRDFTVNEKLTSGDVPSPRGVISANEADTLDDPHEEIGRLRRELAAARALLAQNEAAPHSLDAAASADRTAFLEAMLETVPVGVVLADATGRIVHGNSWVERNLKHPVLRSEDTDSYGEWVSYHADGRPVESHEYPLSRVIKEGEDHAELDVHYQRGDGTRFWMRVIGEPVRNLQGQTIGATVALVDIEDEMQLLEEKEILLGEVNHRVKNSLQLVSSILSLQARSAQDEVAALLHAASARVQAISSVHAALYHDDDVRTVEFGDYLQRFCERLADGHGADEKNISLNVEAEKLTLPADKAVPLSLIINELVTNAFKYAFVEGVAQTDNSDVGPRIDVRLVGNSDGTAFVEVSDNGKGAGTNPPVDGSTETGLQHNEATSGLGTKLTSILARQLDARITKTQANGWIVKLEFEP